MSKVNLSKAANIATSKAKSRGQEANVTQVRNVLNDFAIYLVEGHDPWEVLESIYRLASHKIKAK